MKNDLEKEFQWYLDNQEELVKKYSGKFIAIKNYNVLGAYTERRDAIQETLKGHARGTFIVQKCSPGKQDYTHAFRSRIATPAY